jgi:hypothetical protein
MKWSASNTGNFFFTKLKGVVVTLATKVKIFGKEKSMQLGPLLKRQRIISDRKTGTTGRNGSIGFRQILRRLGIITAAKLSETIQETTQAIKYDMEVNKRTLREGSEQVPTEITIKRTNLNEKLVQQLREQIGIDCEAAEIDSLQIEHKRYYSYNFPMSPKIITNRGCIIVKGRGFNLIQVIQRN